MIFSKQWIFGIALLFCIHANAQNSQKLPATNIIGTAVSVNYDNNTPSTTVNTIANVFDGKFDTYFASYERSGTWVGLDLGEKHVITKVAYCPRKDSESRLQLGVIEGANRLDFEDAVPLCLITQTPPANRMTEETVNCSRGFRYVRYVGPYDVRCNIAELEFWGYKGNGNDTKLYQTTNLPDVIIHTTNAAEILNREDYVRGTISFISENGTKIHTDNLDIRGRGNASWSMFPKKPYRIKLDHKSRVLGLPANERSWTLINNYGDKTLMRNLLAFDLSQRLQMSYTPAGVPVNVYLNGEFKGCYQLCDHVEVATNRVEVVKITPGDIAMPNLSGGYCLKIDAYAYSEKLWFSSQSGIPVSFKYPQQDGIVSAQYNYIRSHFNLMETAVFSSNYKDPVNGYRKYLDTETFIRFFLVGEFSGNTDTYWQTFIYKKRGNDQFFWGPVWDSDLAYENDNRTYPINTRTGNEWIFASTGSVCHGRVREMVNRLLTDTEFVNQMKSIWAYYRDQKIINEEALLGVVDQYAIELEASQKLNHIRWGKLNEKVHQNPKTYGSYAGEVENVKNYIKGRIKWMDNKLGYKPAPPPPPPPPPPPLTATDEKYFKDVNVWAYASNVYIEGIDASTLVEFFDTSGNRIFSKMIHADIIIPKPAPLRNGMYMVRLTNPKGNSKVVKCYLE